MLHVSSVYEGRLSASSDIIDVLLTSTDLIGQNLDVISGTPDIAKTDLL